MKASFTITGEFLTETARNMVLSENPIGAHQLLATGLVGDDGASHENVATRILRGEIDLEGDSNSGITMALSSTSKKYLRDLNFVFAGRVRIKGRWFRPVAEITTFGPDDARATPGGALVSGWNRRRAEFYLKPDEIIPDLEIDDLDLGYVVFAPCGEPPHWRKYARNPREALDEFFAAGRNLDERGNHLLPPREEADAWIKERRIRGAKADKIRESADQAEKERQKVRLQRIGEEVRTQAGEDFFPLTLTDGRVVSVPRVPFLHWAFRAFPEYKLPTWVPISPSGMKMQGDSREHSDWVLGAGLSLEEAYDQKVLRAAYAKMTDLQIAFVDSKEKADG